jgi:branched-chain amino acid transport system substrate-binding protein
VARFNPGRNSGSRRLGLFAHFTYLISMKRRTLLTNSSALALGALAFPHISVATTDDLVIGCSAATSGPLAGFGENFLLGVNAAFAQANAQGGVNGRKVSFRLLDDGYVPERSVENVKKLIADKEVLALMGCMGTPNNTAFTPMIEATDIVHLGPLTGAGSLRGANIKNVYHVRASYNDEISRLVTSIVAMGLKDLAIVYLDNGFGKELLGVASAALKSVGVRAVTEQALATDGKNIDAVVKAVLGARPSAMLLCTAGAASTGVAAKVRAASPEMPIAGVSVSFTSSGIAQLGDAAAGIALTMVYPDATRGKYPLVRKYQAAMLASGNKSETFNMGSLESYIDATLMIHALKESGNNPNRSKVREAVGSIRKIDLGGFAVDFAPPSTHVGSTYVNLGILNKDGRYIS